MPGGGARGRRHGRRAAPRPARALTPSASTGPRRPGRATGRRAARVGLTAGARCRSAARTRRRSRCRGRGGGSASPPSPARWGRRRRPRARAAASRPARRRRAPRARTRAARRRAPRPWPRPAALGRAATPRSRRSPPTARPDSCSTRACRLRDGSVRQLEQGAGPFSWRRPPRGSHQCEQLLRQAETSVTSHRPAGPPAL